jgi:hypothetical protein
MRIRNVVKTMNFQEGFETTEEIVTAYNSPAGRLIDDEGCGENVKQMQGGRLKRLT